MHLECNPELHHYMILKQQNEAVQSQNYTVCALSHGLWILLVYTQCNTCYIINLISFNTPGMCLYFFSFVAEWGKGENWDTAPVLWKEKLFTIKCRVLQWRQQRWALIQSEVWDLCSCTLQMFPRHGASPLSQLLCTTPPLWGFGGGRSEQNRSDIKQRAAPPCNVLEGSLDVLLDMKAADGGAAQQQHRAVCQRKARRGTSALTCAHTDRSNEVEKIRQNYTHMAESIIMPSEIA